MSRIATHFWKLGLVEERHHSSKLWFLKPEKRQDTGGWHGSFFSALKPGVLESKEEQEREDLYITPWEVETQKDMIYVEEGL